MENAPGHNDTYGTNMTLDDFHCESLVLRWCVQDRGAHYDLHTQTTTTGGSAPLCLAPNDAAHYLRA